MPAETAASVPALADQAHRLPVPQRLGKAADPRSTPSRSRWADLGARTASALVLLPFAIAAAWFGGLPWLALVAAGACILAWEWRLMWKSSCEPLLLLFAGVAYVALGVASLLWLRADPIMGRANLMFMLVAVWAGDIGAYVGGRAIGGPRLAPTVSPGKTISGAITGLVASALAGLLASVAWPHGAPSAAMTLAVLIGIAAQIGDLLESQLKRICKVKDSGRLIPGHGGLLDRLDGVLLAAPLTACLGIWLGSGLVLWT